MAVNTAVLHTHHRRTLPTGCDRRDAARPDRLGIAGCADAGLDHAGRAEAARKTDHRIRPGAAHTGQVADVADVSPSGAAVSKTGRRSLPVAGRRSLPAVAGRRSLPVVAGRRSLPDVTVECRSRYQERSGGSVLAARTVNAALRTLAAG